MPANNIPKSPQTQEKSAIKTATPTRGSITEVGSVQDSGGFTSRQTSEDSVSRRQDGHKEINLKTREWLMILFICILVQYILTLWIGGYGNEANIVSYVSFASTIVSLILAVLAIVYTYYQNASQQRDSSSINAQVLRLSDVVDKVKDSTSNLEDEVGGVSTVAKHIEELTDKLSNLQAGLVELELREKVGVIRRNVQRINVEKTFPIEILLNDSLSVTPLYKLFDSGIPVDLQEECTKALCESLHALAGKQDSHGSPAQPKLAKRIELLITEIEDKTPSLADMLKKALAGCSTQDNRGKQEVE